MFRRPLVSDHLQSLLLISLLLFFSASFIQASEISEQDLQTLKRNCADCHTGNEAEAGFDLKKLSSKLHTPADEEPWILIHDRIAKGEMPPADDAEPIPAPEKSPLLTSLSRVITSQQQARQAETGRVQYRRLNRVEYENTLRDLLHLPGLEVKEMLPTDAEAYGFDNVGSALRISYIQMEKYLAAARLALNEAAWLAPEIQPYQFRLPFTDIRRFQITNDLITLDQQAVLLRQPNTAQTPWRLDAIEIPFPGQHTIRLRARAATYSKLAEQKPEAGQLEGATAPQVISIYQGSRILGSLELTSEFSEQSVTEWLNPQEMLTLYVPTMRDWNPRWSKEAYTGPAVALDWVEIQGPVSSTWPTPGYQVLFDQLPVELWTEQTELRPPAELGEPKHPKRYPKIEFPNRRDRYHVVSENPEADARRLLLRFMKQAIRQPVPDTEVERYFALVKEEFERKKPFHEAMITGYTAILCSPDFLFFQEQPGLLDDASLANRLAYFLWRSQPDRKLRELAAQGKLTQPQILKQETERLLNDPKSERMVEDFTAQWLDLREIRSTQPDEKLYPEFDDYLLESMVAETHLFFTEMLKANLPARSVVSADFSFVNNTLADLYELPHVTGVELRKVSLPADSVRGGFLTQAALLKVTANGTTTSPVTRGAWVLEHLLGEPAPPPPPNVPAIEPDTRGATTIRELLELHRADAACAGCHAKIDPPGFALESFDVIGGWRTHYRSAEKGKPVNEIVDYVKVNYREGLPVDPAGKFQDGREFKNIRDFRSLLLADEEQLARNLTNRLLVFATGAGISFADRQEVETILQQTSGNNYGLRDILHSIVQSNIFRKK